MAVAIDHQVLGLYSDMAAAAAVESTDDYPIVEVAEAAVRHVLEPRRLNRLPTDVFRFDSIVEPVVQLVLDYVERIVAPAAKSAVELNPIRRLTRAEMQKRNDLIEFFEMKTWNTFKSLRL